jgi:hypothetical protein
MKYLHENTKKISIHIKKEKTHTQRLGLGHFGRPAAKENTHTQKATIFLLCTYVYHKMVFCYTGHRVAALEGAKDIEANSMTIEEEGKLLNHSSR